MEGSRAAVAARASSGSRASSGAGVAVAAGVAYWQRQQWQAGSSRGSNWASSSGAAALCRGITAVAQGSSVVQLFARQGQGQQG